MRVPLSMISAVALLTLISVPTASSNPLYLQNPEGGAIRGLIIGIDAYEHVRQLKGSVADARDIDGSLRSMGTSDITMLVDGQANRANILQSISSLVQRTKANDLIILSIAGHGAQEPETVKGSEPDGMQDVFLLPGFEPTPDGSRQRILGSEFNHFIRQFELRGARVLFVADTCHGGGMAREIDPRAAEMSFRQVPHYTLPVDKLVPVTNEADPVTDLDLDHTAFLAAVDRYTKAPEVKIPGIEGLRGALSYAVARAIEGGADADHDGKVTLKELFANVRQVVYQLSDQRQNVVTKTSPGQFPDKDVVFQLTRGLPPAPSQPSPLQSSPSQPAATTSVVANAPQNRSPSPAESALPARPALPVRIAALDGGTNYFAKLTSRDANIEIVRPVDDPDIIWDPKSRDVISWGDVIAYKVDQGDLATVVDRTAAIRELKRIATKAPQSVRVGPDDEKFHNEQVVKIELSDLAGRALVLFDISGDGTIQMLYPVGSDEALRREATLQLPLRVREPFGAEQVVAITSTERMTGLEEGLLQLNLRKAPGQLIKIMAKLLPSDARVGSIGFYTAP
ncbi:MAG: caspase family protein [Bradyrhizobium sp.]